MVAQSVIDGVSTTGTALAFIMFSSQVRLLNYTYLLRVGYNRVTSVGVAWDGGQRELE